MINTREHWCKACTTTFYVNLGERFTGDVFLVCPACRREHFRHFAMGTAMHCDIGRRHDDPTKVFGSLQRPMVDERPSPSIDWLNPPNYPA